MDYILGLLIAIIAIIVVLSLRSFTTLFHELGHALPALFFSEGPVNVYIGTYGDISNCYQFHGRRLNIYFRLNLLDWKIGMCQHQPTDKNWKRALIVLGGPIASLLIAMPLLWLNINVELSSITFFIFSVFIFAAGLDFLFNMTPFSTPIMMHNGAVSFCDGYVLLGLFMGMFAPKSYKELEQLFDQGAYQQVQDQAEALIEKGTKYRSIYDLAIAASIALGQQQDALWFYEKLKDQQKLQYFDYASIAQLYIELDNEEAALQCLDVCISMNNEVPNALLNRGLLHLKQDRWEQAIKDFTLAFYYAPDHRVLLVHRGLAKTKAGDFSGALEDYTKAEQMGEKSTYFYHSLAVYYEATGDPTAAHKYYSLAKDKNYNTSIAPTNPSAPEAN